MEANKVENVVLNASIISKLSSISQDLKLYINVNAHFATLDKENVFPRMKQEDIDEIIDIRSRIKKLRSRLDNDLFSKESNEKQGTQA